ncbi:MAG: capsular polysaccharide biosynthesis protein [Glaciecola sp.]
MWATTEISRLEGVVFILRSPQAEIAQFAKKIIELFLQYMPIYVVKEPTQFQELIVSEQICQARQGILLKHDVFEPLFSKFRSAFQEPTNVYPNKVYVSRSKLNGNEGLVLAERILERNLEVEGYTVIHPQELSVNVQLNFYANAEKLIFSDGSAFHLYILVAQQFQECFMVWRRRKHNDFDIQLKSFVGKSTYGKPFLDGYFTPVNEAHNSARHKAKLDYKKLKTQLVEDGFIHGDEWEVPVERDFTEEIELLEKRLKKRLVYVEEKSL